MNRGLLDADGENRAVRSFLMVYSCNDPATVGSMRSHMIMSGWEGLYPRWVAGAVDQHLTKAGAQDWLRYLFALELAA